MHNALEPWSAVHWIVHLTAAKLKNESCFCFSRWSSSSNHYIDNRFSSRDRYKYMIILRTFISAQGIQI